MPRERTDQRIKELKQQVWERRRKRIKVFFYAVGIVIVCFFIFNVKRLLAVFLWDIKTFKVKEVRILPYEARPMITGLIEIETGKSMLFLDIDDLREQIMRINEVENCTIRKFYPSTLEINVTVRKPWIILEKESAIFFIDKTGKILSPPDNPEKLLRVTGITLSENSVDTKDLWKLEVLKELEKWYNFYNLQKYFSIESISIVKPTEIVLNERDGTRKIILLDKNIREKFEKLRSVLEECNKNATLWDYIDIRFENPYVKLKDR